MNIIFVIIIVLFTFSSSLIRADDWGICADYLDSLRRAASYASDVARNAESAKNEAEDKKNDLTLCLSFPNRYDRYGNGCGLQRSEYNNSVSDYRSALSNLEIELLSVQSKIHRVEAECGVDFSPSVSRPDKSNQKTGIDCSIYQQFKGMLSDSVILETCKKKMAEEKCKKCLEIK